MTTIAPVVCNVQQESDQAYFSKCWTIPLRDNTNVFACTYHVHGLLGIKVMSHCIALFQRRHVTGVNNKTNDGWFPLAVQVSCPGSLSNCHGLLGHLNRKELLLMLLITSRFFLLWQVKRSVVKQGYYKYFSGSVRGWGNSILDNFILTLTLGPYHNIKINTIKNYN